MFSIKNNKNRPLLIIGGLLVLAVVIALITSAQSSSKQPVFSDNLTSSSGSTELPNQIELNTVPNETEQLLYLIEEEKLAHDVYTVMYQKYGAKVFGNILESETTHQGRVLTLLEGRDIPDPRSDQIGVFNNAELQKLYDVLIEQGNISATEAYKVGVAIEEKDIADISTQLETSTADDIVSVLESLRSGSESHLRAFNRQLGRVNN